MWYLAGAAPRYCGIYDSESEATVFVLRFRFEFDLSIEFRRKSFICVGLRRDKKDFSQRFMDATPNMSAGGDVRLASCVQMV